jgi:hypothetical protein
VKIQAREQFPSHHFTAVGTSPAQPQQTENMHTHTQNSSAHLSTVQELLTRLDQMKNDGLGARERLEFIIEEGSNLVEEFDFEDAFDLEHRAMCKRLEALEDMATTQRAFRQQWELAPVQEEVRDAAGRLLEHTNKFIKDAQVKERKVEIDMLSNIWDWGEDLTHMYPWLTSGRPKPKPVEIPKEIKEFAEKKEALYKQASADQEAKRKKWAEDLAADFDQADGVKESDQAPPKKSEFEKKLEEGEKKYKHGIKASDRTELPLVPTEDVCPDATEKIVAKVTRDEDVKEAESELDVGGEDNQEELTRDAWTMALRELTTHTWKFSREMKGRVGPEARNGTVMLWNTTDDKRVHEFRLEILEDDDQFLVKGRLLINGETARYSGHEDRFTTDGVVKLHLDPNGFLDRLK